MISENLIKMCETCRYWEAIYQTAGTCAIFEREAMMFEVGCDEWVGE